MQPQRYCFSTIWYATTTPAGICLLKMNNRNTRARCEICSKLIIKTLERRHRRRSGVFIVNFEHISHLVLVCLLLTLKKYLLVGTLLFLGLWWPKPFDTSLSCTHNGMHSCWQDHRIFMWTSTQMFKRWRSLCQENSSCMCGKAARYQFNFGWRPRIFGIVKRFAIRLKSNGKKWYALKEIII